MMGRFCRYVDKVFDFGSHIQTLSETRQRPQIPASAVFVSAWAMFATGRGSLNSLEKEARIPARLRGLVGSKAPSADTMGLVYSQLKSAQLRQMLSAINHRVRRNKALGPGGNLMVVAVDGHEFFASRKRCCPDCQTREIKLKDGTVTEYYHRGVICHLIGHDLALPLDVELQQPGEGEETAAKRLLERVFLEYERFVDVVTGDALYLDAPFINFCLAHHKDVVVVIKGDHRLLLQDAQQLFSQRTPDEWTERRRMIRSWDEEGFTSCEGVETPLRVLHTEETVRRREQMSGKEREDTSCWYWATTLSKRQLSTRQLWHAGHGRWDIENDCFNTLSTHMALDHCFRHAATAIVNFILTCFMAYVMLQCFWRGNLKPARRQIIGSLIGLADELYRSLGSAWQAPWLAQPP
jgi:Transposase DDE domain